ncbi:hypothetical protein CRYUN_Cryun16bG0041100 [Craigia yunnanensis]
MITIDSISYTSLKDLLPTSPPAITSSTHNSSWHEIPIKNPLVKHVRWLICSPCRVQRRWVKRVCFGGLKKGVTVNVGALSLAN